VAELGPLGLVAGRRVRVRQRDDITYAGGGCLDVVQRDGRLVVELLGVDFVAQERALVRWPRGVEAQRRQEVVNDWESKPSCL
jgi:hypothetical protein